MAEQPTIVQSHGKSRVRVARVWRNASAGRDLIVEWMVEVRLLSDCLPSYSAADNSAVVATDTMKNTVYAKAKECAAVVSPEDFAVLLAGHFATFYPQVTSAIVRVVEKPWERVAVDGEPHHHGFKLGLERRTTVATVGKSGSLQISSGIEGLSLLKTTQSGFEGFFRDQYTILPETDERMLATEVTASWSYRFERLSDISAKRFCFTKEYLAIKKALVDIFFGDPKVGVYSPSVQNTLYLMGKGVLDRFPNISSIHLRMPNLHFLPINLPKGHNQSLVEFAGDVFVPVDEPHGTIQATLSRPVSKM